MPTSTPPTTQPLLLQGDWTSDTLHTWLAREPQLHQTQQPLQVQIEVMDTNGALLFLRLFGTAEDQWPAGLTRQQKHFLALVARYPIPEVPAREAPRPISFLGRRFIESLQAGRLLLDFVGRICWSLLQVLRHPARLDFKMLLNTLQQDGLHAVPIIALLSFLLGCVIAYQGGVQLANYGANIFIVELVALIYLRELGPLIAAILVAGRSGSSYAAQLASMTMNQEVLALRSLGQNPFDLLVLPKILGLMLTLPLLTVLADISGLIGGMLIAQAQLDIDPLLFWQRLAEAVSPAHLWAGLIKTPFFALTIVTVGCMQGLLPPAGAEAVGRRTTRSVVQAIFLVIVLDALFSIPLNRMGW